MEELMDLIVADESPSQVSDKIKDILYSKAAEKIDSMRPSISAALFNGSESEEEE